MTMLWGLSDIRKDMKEVTSSVKTEKALIDELYYICLAAAQTAKNEHSYINQKGELESSTGFVILKNRHIKLRWKWLASTGTNPSLGFKDFSNFVTTNLMNKSTLPDGSYIPKKSIIAVVFAAAPYAGAVDDKGRTVLSEFMPDWTVVHSKIVNAMQ